MNAHQIVNGHALRTVMLRPFATVYKAMVESMKAEKCLMMQLGEKDQEMGRCWGRGASFHSILGRQL
jgi:hypothetical protein